MGTLMWLVLIGFLFFLGRVLTRNPEIVVRIQQGSVAEQDYPEGSEARERVKLLHENPSEWLRRNDKVTKTYRSMGYIAYAMAVVGLLIFAGQWIYVLIMPN